LGLPAAIWEESPRRCWADDDPLDLLIAGGTVVDGSGGKPLRADVGIRGDDIAALGNLAGQAARRTLDATGLAVAPGFIDIHTHSDRTLLRDGLAQSAIRQGVTTHVIGNCGSSPAPLRAPQAVAGVQFQTFGEFLQVLLDGGVAINICALVGHNRVRGVVMGFDNRRPSEGELVQMQGEVAAAMKAGAVGLSTGLVSPPGTFSETGELIELARVAGQHGGLYASHIRGEAGTLVDAVNEALEVGRKANLPVQISHHKAAGKENWGKTRITLAAIEAAAAGQQVRVDVYPYVAGSAGLTQLIPPWAHEGGLEAMLKRLADRQSRQQVARDMERGTRDWPNFFRIDWNDIQITHVRTEKNRPWVGRRVAELAQARGCSGIDACIDLVLEEQGEVGMINFVMNEEEMRGVLRHPLSMIGSDGSAVDAERPDGQPHPRFYGCFPRVLGRYVREEKLLSLETAIHKMTAMPAQQLGLARRGLIKQGYAADIVLLNPNTVIDLATFDQPHRYPAGIEAVIVNGQVVLQQGKHSGKKPGRLLRPQR
jgi:N-acyl-D-aspartate/D-glutamate deacylase